MCWTAAATGLRYAALRYFNACGARIRTVRSAKHISRNPPHSAGPAGRKRTAQRDLGVRLRTTQRPTAPVSATTSSVRSGAGAYSCARIPAARRRKHRLQPRQRTGFFRTRGDRGGAPRYRSCNPCRGKGAAAATQLGSLRPRRRRRAHSAGGRATAHSAPSCKPHGTGTAAIRWDFKAVEKNFISVRAEA